MDYPALAIAAGLFVIAVAILAVTLGIFEGVSRSRRRKRGTRGQVRLRNLNR